MIKTSTDDHMGNPLLNMIMSMRKTGDSEAISWKGSKIPRGHAFNGGTIGWAQHGILTGEDGKDLGTYERIVEFGGKDKDEHEIEAWPRRSQ